MKKILLLICLMYCTIAVLAQSWQWGKQGGGADAFNYADGHENVRRMTTDAQGNVFCYFHGFKNGT